MAHFFAKRAPHINTLLQVTTLKEYIDLAWELAETPEAKQVFEVGAYEENDASDLEISLGYFGAAGEFLAEVFLNYFGNDERIGITDLKSTNSNDVDEIDAGIDHIGISTVDRLFKDKRHSKFGSPVYVQTKFTRNPRKQFKTNDGSRLPNFYMNAQARARIEEAAYQARYVLFTTTDGVSGEVLNWRLNKNTYSMTEIINRKMISSRIDGNIWFWNQMRKIAGLSEFNMKYESDDEARKIANELKKIVDISSESV